MLDRLRSDDGTSLIEVSVVVALLGTVVAFLIGGLTSAQTNLERQISRSSSNDEARLAIQSLDHDVRSGNVVYDPASENYPSGDVAPGMSLRVYTQSNGINKCVQWRITSAGTLERRDWSTTWLSGGNVGSWRTVATGIVNRDPDNTIISNPGNTPVTAFSRSQFNLVNVNLWVDDDPTARKGHAVNIQASISGRNTLFYNTNTRCGPAVPQPGVQASDLSQVPPY